MLARRRRRVVSRIRPTVEDRFQYTGDLAQEPLPEVLRTIHSIESPACSRSSRARVTKQVYLLGGNIIFATSTDRSESLGEYLRRSALISSGELKASVGKLDLAEGQGRRHGELLVEMGILTDAQLRQIVTEQVKALLYAAFSWEQGSRHVRGRPVQDRRAHPARRADVPGDRRRHPPDARPAPVRLAARPVVDDLRAGRGPAGDARRLLHGRRGDAALAGGRPADAARSHHDGPRRPRVEREAALCVLGAAPHHAARDPSRAASAASSGRRRAASPPPAATAPAEAGSGADERTTDDAPLRIRVREVRREDRGDPELLRPAARRVSRTAAAR